MDGSFHGKPYEQMDDLGGKNHPYFWFNTHMTRPLWLPTESLLPFVVQLSLDLLPWKKSHSLEQIQANVGGSP